MQARTYFLATFLHTAAIVGVGLSVHAWDQEGRPVVEVRLRPTIEREWVPEDTRIDVPVDPPAWSDDEPVAEPQAPEPAVAEDAIDSSNPGSAQPENAARIAPEAVVSMPDALWASDVLLSSLRPKPIRETPVLPTSPIEPSPTKHAPAEPAQPRVKATALDEWNQPPHYPAAAERRGVGGEVILRLFVSAKGEVGRVEIVKSSGLTKWHKQLDHAAIAAVCRWRYTPAELNGKPVATKIDVPVTFVSKKKSRRR